MGFIQCVASWLIPWFRASAGGEQAMGTSSAQPRSTHCLPACSSGAGLWFVWFRTGLFDWSAKNPFKCLGLPQRKGS